MADRTNELVFSAVSLWEIAIKNAQGKKEFQVDAGLLRRGMLRRGYQEMVITSEHAISAAVLPPLHKDPFDRLLIAQAAIEGVVLLTADRMVSQYPGPIQLV
jgi:PIN domain nuclease of toxin-antitoxin system